MRSAQLAPDSSELLLSLSSTHWISNRSSFLHHRVFPEWVQIILTPYAVPLSLCIPKITVGLWNCCFQLFIWASLQKYFRYASFFQSIASRPAFIVCNRNSTTSQPGCTLPRFPDTNTTSTAAYAAVAAKMLSRVALVETRMLIAKRRMNSRSKISRALGSVTK